MDISLYPHQERAFDLLRAGKNVILQAPTGSGKTRAAIYPFLKMAEFPQIGFPRKCVYTVPMRVLANQFVAEYREVVNKYNLRQGLNLKVSIQTGENSGDPFYESDLIFTTIDQALSRFLNYPYGVSKRKANLNAAVVMGSYLVFDEFHLLDPKSTLPTTLAMLKMLNGIAPFMLMTATFSKTMLCELAEQLNAEIIPGTLAEENAFLSLPSQKKTRYYRTCTEPLTAQLVLETHNHRSLVICNAVDRARAIFDDLKQLCPETEIILLHSRYLAQDRLKAQALLEKYFGKNGDRTTGSVIAVATQAIEVGVDITCEALHTELAPANSVIQRAGRCARYADDIGTVTIYSHSLDQGEIIDLTERINPYAGQGETIRHTWSAFVALTKVKSEFTFADEQTVLSQVHAEADRRTLEQLNIKGSQHQIDMFDLMAGRENLANPSALIRDVFQVRVTISDNPDSLRDAPFDAEAFGLHPGILSKYAKAWLEDASERPFTLKTLILREKDKNAGDSDTYKRPEYDWDPVQTVKSLVGAALVVIHPSLARYDAQRGLILGESSDPDGWQASLPDQSQRREEKTTYNYRLETYERHIELVYKAAFGANGAWDEIAGLAIRLERRFGWQRGDVRKATELAVLLHDIGKLSMDWQKWVRAYQAKITDMESTQQGEAYAHTDSRTQEHKEIEKSMPRRPTHAVESALASNRLYAAAFEEDSPLIYAIYSAIARHHAPFADSNGEYRLITDADKHVRATLSKHGSTPLDPNWELITDAPANADAQAANIAKPEDGASYWAYLLMARVLRRADQEGTREGGL